MENDIKYAGEYHDDENELIYLRNRYYDPDIRRFTSEDPIEDGLNWYAYCENNPIAFIDAFGTQPDWAKKIREWCENTSLVKWFYDETNAGTFNWLYDAVGFTRDSRGVFHAKNDAWQKYFGYNDAYDKVFDTATDMKNEKYSFVSNQQGFTIWAWKGNYLNLGNGAEIGLYTGDGVHLQCATDYQMPITLKLSTNSGTVIFEYTSTTWWATGFNPNYHDISSSDMKATASINFSNYTDFYYAFKSKYGTTSGLSFDVQTHVVQITW